MVHSIDFQGANFNIKGANFNIKGTLTIGTMNP